MVKYPRQDKIRNKCIIKRVRVAPSVEKIVISHLKGFGMVLVLIRIVGERNYDNCILIVCEECL